MTKDTFFKFAPSLLVALITIPGTYWLTDLNNRRNEGRRHEQVLSDAEKQKLADFTEAMKLLDSSLWSEDSAEINEKAHRALGMLEGGQFDKAIGIDSAMNDDNQAWSALALVAKSNISSYFRFCESGDFATDVKSKAECELLIRSDINSVVSKIIDYLDKRRIESQYRQVRR